MSEKSKKPNPIDVHVGSRVRLKRTMMGMSQEKLGESLGVTFQQVQKYEKGANRIGASRLQQISLILKAPIAFFFEGAPGHTLASGAPGFAEGESSTFSVDFLSTPECMQLNRSFSRISDAKVRRKIIDLVKTLAEDEPARSHV